jgi:hypothetical protein
MTHSLRVSTLLSVFAILAIVATATIFLSTLRLGANLSDAWEESGWTYRKEITIDNANVDEDLTDFPLLVKITEDTDIGAHARSDGYDLRFTLPDGTSLPYERESWSGGGGSAATGIFWVKVPTITTAADTTIYAYYGKSDATDGQSATSVWDNNFKGVWHLKETGTSPTVNDSTSNANNSTTQTWTPTTSGQIDGAGSCVAPKYIDIADNAGLRITSQLTLEAWYNASGPGWSGLIGKGTESPYRGWTLGIDASTEPYFHAGKSDGTYTAVAGSTLSAGWHHLVAVLGDKQRLFVDGAKLITESDYSVGDTTGSDLVIGRFYSAVNNYYANGLIDEVRISSTARSAAWIKFEYQNQGSGTNEIAFGTEEDGTAPTVTGVSSPTADGTYGSGSTLSVAVTFSKAVTVTGTPQITLATGTSNAVLSYGSMSGTTTLLFPYTVAAGHTSSHLDYASDAIALYDGTIKSAMGIDAILTLAAPGAPGSLSANKDFVIDGIAPVVSAVGGSIGKTDATVTWTTEEAGSSIVEYGLTTAYGTTTTETDTSTRVTSHSVLLSSLTCATTYHRRVKSKDAAGNTGVSADGTFDTTSCATTGHAAERRKLLQELGLLETPSSSATDSPADAGAFPATSSGTAVSTGSSASSESACTATYPANCFTVTGSGKTVTDAVTGLTWRKCAVGRYGKSCEYGASTRAQQKDSQAFCKKLGTGWRLPTIAELLTIVNFSGANPSIDPAAFPNTPPMGFWSSSVFIGGPSTLWQVDFRDGSATAVLPSEDNAVRCVRSAS